MGCIYCGSILYPPFQFDLSFVQKIDEVQEFLLRYDISLAYVTKTWLKETIADSAVSAPGYTIIRKDRTTNNHGGVCLYVTYRCFKYHRLEELCCCTDDEILWVHLRPAARLPRGFSCLIAVWYHPPRSRYQHPRAFVQLSCRGWIYLPKLCANYSRWF